MAGFLSSLTLADGLALAGLCQTVVIIVYIALRARDWRQTSVALAYFGVLALGFLAQIALRMDDGYGVVLFLLFLAQTTSAPLCYLLVMQVARWVDLPERRHFHILWVIPVAVIPVLLLRNVLSGCGAATDIRSFFACDTFFAVLYWSGAMAGALCLLMIWFRRDVFVHLRHVRGGRERYWLVLMLVVTHVLAVGVGLLRSGGQVEDGVANVLLTVLGMAFCYLATTTLFRVYPASLALSPVPRLSVLRPLSEQEMVIAARVERLLAEDKVYQEPAFSRTDLARETGVSESILSRVVNVHFGKSFPRLLNDYRIEDAKMLLKNPDIPVQTVAAESGFNSLASFNRVFRDVTGESPTAWRQFYMESHKADPKK